MKKVHKNDQCVMRVATDEAAGEYELQIVLVDTDEVIIRRRAPFGSAQARALERALEYRDQQPPGSPLDFEKFATFMKGAFQ